MGALLLTVTGRAWLIEIAVEERTVAMEHQVRERLEAVRAREAAEASNRAKSDFLSRMSHELCMSLETLSMPELAGQHAPAGAASCAPAGSPSKSISAPTSTSGWPN